MLQSVTSVAPAVKVVWHFNARKRRIHATLDDDLRFSEGSVRGTATDHRPPQLSAAQGVCFNRACEELNMGANARRIK